VRPLPGTLAHEPVCGDRGKHPGDGADLETHGVGGRSGL
jgi:hypothetical protein